MERIIHVTRSAMPGFEEYCEEIRGLWDSRWLTNNGPKHEQLRRELADYLHVPHIDLLTNGHMAIELSLQAMGLRGEVITTPFTFASTTQAIVRSGLTPVFCDIDPVTFCLDANQIEPLITSRTCAIVPVHVYGSVCNVEAIDQIAKKHGLKVLYDAAHAFGVQYRGQGVGSFGDVSCFSFHATKVFHTVEGGAACFADEKFGARLARMKNFGLVGGGVEDATEMGANAKLSEFHAAMGLCNLRHIDEVIAKRGAVTALYRERFTDVDGLQMTPIQDGVQSNYAYFPLVIDEEKFGANRETVLERLAAHNIHARRYFYPLTSAFRCWHNAYDLDATPIAQRISQQVLCLPLYPDLDTETVNSICEIVLRCRK